MNDLNYRAIKRKLKINFITVNQKININRNIWNNYCKVIYIYFYKFQENK